MRCMTPRSSLSECPSDGARGSVGIALLCGIVLLFAAAIVASLLVGSTGPDETAPEDDPVTGPVDEPSVAPPQGSRPPYHLPSLPPGPAEGPETENSVTLIGEVRLDATG